MEVAGFSTIMQLISHSAMSHQYAGMEYGGECYCGNNLIAGASAPLVDCAMPCNDNGSEYCGAGNRPSLYSFGNLPTLVSSSMATSSMLMSSTAASTSTGPVIVRTAGGYAYVDCHTDSVAAKALTGAGAQGSMMTVKYCARLCGG